MIIFTRHDKNSQIEENRIILLEDETTTIFVNETTNQEIITNTTSNITSFKVKCSNIIPLDYKNNTIEFFIGKNYSRGQDFYQTFYLSNSSNKRLSFQNEGVISYYNPDIIGIIPISKAETNSSLLKKCYEIFLKIGINRSNIQLGSIRNSIASSYSNNKKTILGYGDQTVVFNQIINGFPVGGEKGKITLRFGKGSELSIFRDDRVIIKEIVYKKNMITSLNNTVSKMSSYSSQLPEGVNQLLDWDLVIYVPTFDNIPINGYYLHYIFRFFPKGFEKARYVVIPSD
jgi:hypothetical protein